VSHKNLNPSLLSFYADDDSDHPEDEWPDEIDFKNLDIEFLRRILKKDGSFYPIFKGCDNPYRDGYHTLPPKKPRAHYLFYQCTVRSYFQKRFPSAVQSELMSKLGELWRSMDDDDKKVFQILADEESKQYEKEKILLEKAQKPNAVWQPLRRCRQVLERLASDSFADIFQEPVNLNDFPDYEEVVDVMMDLGTVRDRIINKKYMVPEQFARDMRRVSLIDARYWVACGIL
jgi:Bromodomain/HMG (high mobility group) box